MLLLTYTGPLCATCHTAPVDHSHAALNPIEGWTSLHCAPCADRHYREWKSDTQEWLDHHSVACLINGKPNRVSVKSIKELFPKAPRARAKPRQAPIVAPAVVAPIEGYSADIVRALHHQIAELKAELKAWKGLRRSVA